MRILLDEDLDLRFRFSFPDHNARTVWYMNWLGRDDGELLPLARSQFDALITCDHSIEFQQNITEEDVRVIVLYPKSDHLADLQAMVPDIEAALAAARRGEVMRVYQRD